MFVTGVSSVSFNSNSLVPLTLNIIVSSVDELMLVSASASSISSLPFKSKVLESVPVIKPLSLVKSLVAVGIVPLKLNVIASLKD